MHASETLLSQFSLKLKIVSNSARMQALDTLLSNILCSSNCFKYCQNASLKDLAFKYFSQFQIVPNGVRMHGL